MSVLKKLASAGVIAALALMTTGLAHALPMSETFDVEIFSGPEMGQTGTLDIDYDGDDVTGTGSEELAFDLFDMSLMILGQTLTEVDDIGFSATPRLGFLNGVIDSLDFVAEIPSLSILISGFFIGDGIYRMESRAAAPVPGTALLALLGLALIARTRRRA